MAHIAHSDWVFEQSQQLDTAIATHPENSSEVGHPVQEGAASSPVKALWHQSDPQSSVANQASGASGSSTSGSGKIASPTLAIAQNAVTVPEGGSVVLPVNVSSSGGHGATSVTITGLASYESLTDTLDHKIFTGGSITLTAAEVNSGLSLASSYSGTGQPVNTLTVTATETIGQHALTSAPQTITVTDPATTTATVSTTASSTSAGPVTSLHYTPNGNFGSNGAYLPGQDGFNLADVSSVSALNSLPAGVKGLVWLGQTDGVDSAFLSAVQPYIGNPKLFGFYVADEPDPSQVSAANLKAESDWIHANVPGAETFIVLENMGTPTNPSYLNTYNPANTDIDLFGLDPYPVRPQFTGGVDYSVIPDAVSAAEAAGISLNQIVPVYQAFGGGGYSSWTMPTASQEQQILSTWASVVPTPVFDYAYSWGVQDGDSALGGSPALQQVFAAHNADTSITTAPVLPSALASSVEVIENQTYAFKTSDFGYSDPNGSADPLASVTITSLPSTGTLMDNGAAVSAGQVVSAADITGGKFTFTPNHDVTTTGSFNFDVTDSLDSATSANAAAMTLAISADPLPSALSSSVQVVENQTYAFKTSDFGYSDPNGSADPLASVAITSLPSTGTLTDNGAAVSAGQVISAADIAGGKFTFTPNHDVTTTGSFNFDVTDSLDGATSASAAAMTLAISADPLPSALTSSVQVVENQTYAFKTSDFGYSDPNGTADPLASVTIASLPSTGTLIDNGAAVSAGQVISAADIAGGKFTFTPNHDVTTAGSFNFDVTDSLDGTTSASAAAMTIDISSQTGAHEHHHSRYRDD
jgi:hypothetical protein